MVAVVDFPMVVTGAPPLRESCPAEVTSSDQRTSVGWGVHAHGER
jgi:hypothetical protein